jgi:hypothetical protein
MTFSSKQKFSLDLVQCKYEKEIEKKLKKKKSSKPKWFYWFFIYYKSLKLILLAIGQHNWMAIDIVCLKNLPGKRAWRLK